MRHLNDVRPRVSARLLLRSGSFQVVFVARRGPPGIGRSITSMLIARCGNSGKTAVVPSSPVPRFAC